MNEQQEKEWINECEKYEKSKGYIPAEILMIPMLVGLSEEGLLEFHSDDEYTIIKSTNKVKG
jgi:hypothetical protein